MKTQVDLSRYRVTHKGKEINAVALLEIEELSCASKFEDTVLINNIKVLALNERGEMVLYDDVVTNFQFRLKNRSN